MQIPSCSAWSELNDIYEKLRRCVPLLFKSSIPNEISLGFHLFFPPARILWIWRPLLNAWLKRSLVWNSDTNGNQASMATGAKITTPIMYSYPLARAFTDPHIPIAFVIGLQACAIYNHRKTTLSIKKSDLYIT